MDKSRGFTLIELLVVIAIIALLMAILMPTLSRAKKQAKGVVCQANLKQWSLIWQLYTDDNDGFFCVAGDVRHYPLWRGHWIIALQPQWETRSNLLRCPMATKRPPGTTGNQGGPFNTYSMQGIEMEPKGSALEEESSYGFNCWLYKPRPGQTEFSGGHPTKYNWKTVNVRGGNNIPIFADSMWRGGCPCEIGRSGDPPQFDGQWSGYIEEMKTFCINRHEGSINMLFLDWTVRKVDLKELWKLKWHRQFETNGPWTTASGCRPSDWPEWMRGFKEY